MPAHKPATPNVNADLPITGWTDLTAHVSREIASVRELIDVRASAILETSELRRTLIETRLEAMDKAIVLRQQEADRIAGHVKGAVDELDKLHVERFDSVRALMAERDKATKTAVDAIHAEMERGRQAVRTALDSGAQMLATAMTGVNQRIDSTIEVRRNLELELKNFARKEEMASLAFSVDKATTKQEAAIEKRFESVNEFRAQLLDQNATFARRGEMEIALRSINEKMDGLALQQQQIKGRDAGLGLAWGIASVALAVVISGISMAFTMMRHP